MILLSILLTAGLDLSLPEFQPEDVSGNYIVSEYDVSGDEFIAVEVPAEELPSNAGLRSEAPAAESDDIVSAIQTMNEDNNSYWELFLDSYPVESTQYLNTVFYTYLGWRINSDGTLSISSSGNDVYGLVEVHSGVTYTVLSVSDVPSTIYFGVVNSQTSPTNLTNFYSVSSSLFEPFTFTASQDGYFVIQSYTNVRHPSAQLSFVQVDQESYTLSELGNAVMEIRSNNDIKFRILIFLTLINFAYPIVISSFKNFFGGGKNV